METTRSAKTHRLVLACLLLQTCVAEAAPYRAVGRGEVPSLIAGAVKEWAGGLGELRSIEVFIRDKSNWEPRYMAAAGAAGVVFGYFEGGKGSVDLGAWNVKVDASGKRLRQSILRGSGPLFRVGLGRPDQGWSAQAAVGLSHGRLLSQTFDLAYKIRY